MNLRRYEAALFFPLPLWGRGFRDCLTSFLHCTTARLLVCFSGLFFLLPSPSSCLVRGSSSVSLIQILPTGLAVQAIRNGLSGCLFPLPGTVVGQLWDGMGWDGTGQPRRCLSTPLLAHSHPLTPDWRVSGNATGGA